MAQVLAQGAEFRIRPRTAIVEVNGQTIGIADDWAGDGGYRFNGPGTYSVYLSSPGFRPAWSQVIVDPSAGDRVARVRMRLQRSDAD